MPNQLHVTRMGTPVKTTIVSGTVGCAMVDASSSVVFVAFSGGPSLPFNYHSIF